MDNQDYRLLKRFITHDSVSLAELITLENISQKTLQKRITRLNTILIGIAQIKERHGRYYLQIIDYHALSHLQVNYLRESLDFNDSEKRQAFILRQLVETKGYLIQDDLADELTISKGTLSKDLVKLKQTLQYYEATIVSVSNHGIKLRLGQQYQLPIILLNETYDYFSSEYRLDEKIKSLIDRIGKTTETVRLKKFTAVLCYLWQLGYRFDETIPHYTNLVRLTPAVQQLTMALGKLRQEPLTENEKDLLYYPLNLKYSDLLDKKLVECAVKENWALIEIIQQQIETHIQVNLDYQHFHEQIKYHLLFLCNRAIFTTPASDIFTNEIVKNYPVAAELALISLTTLEQQLGVIINSVEANYLAIYFQLALDDTQDFLPAVQTVGLVGNIGIGAQQFLKKQLAEVFADQIKVVAIHDLAKLKQPDLNFLLIFSDRPLDLGGNYTPVVRVDELFRTEELSTKITISLVQRAIQAKSCTFAVNYLAPATTTYRELVDQMIDQETEKGHLAASFKRIWHKRELLGSSIFENGVAIPHAINEVKKQQICLSVGILKEPFKAGKREVRFIFLIGIPQNLNQQLNRVLDIIYDFIFNLVHQKDILQNLLHYQIDQPIDQLMEGI
ncbi:BglG family transcription antiterminator [Loigolactobacillus iwatensis]|uniref:BglG family transcription antiterminator n=1 Tax=Loigolactobacillus iwatensis TaxID=1267156 RepID=UPI000F7D75C1|nr:PTS sugar transporter subunit IIA [Loigolactobacillus iwatensis]